MRWTCFWGFMRSRRGREPRTGTPMAMRKRNGLLLGLALAIVAVWIYNASWRVAPPEGAQVRLIAHRGVHQTFRREGLERDTCTAQRIHPPVHDYIENTVRSMQAAFALGADVVELDVHPTTDGHLAVMHDWSLDCRTNGQGATRSHAMPYLRTLDVGHGYTADNGRTYPLRGTGVGQMPELSEVFAALPGRQFLVNFKSREAREGDMLAALVAGQPAWRAAVWGVYGGDEPTVRATQALAAQDGGAAPPVRAWSRRSMAQCLGRYAALGWTGIVPKACQQTTVVVPVNLAPWLWGWPHLMQQRLRAAGSAIVLLGPYEAGDVGSAGIDTLEQLAQVPGGFDGHVWTNRIEVIGPALRR